MLQSDDGVELGLRRLSAYVLEQRTGDPTAAGLIAGLAIALFQGPLYGEILSKFSTFRLCYQTRTEF